MIEMLQRSERNSLIKTQVPRRITQAFERCFDFPFTAPFFANDDQMVGNALLDKSKGLYEKIELFVGIAVRNREDVGARD